MKGEKFIILDVSGVGYKIFLSRKNLLKAPGIGGDFEVFCFLNIRDDIRELYGFLSYKELEFFEILNDISGIGPKTAIEIASIATSEEIKTAIKNNDKKIIEEIFEIGKKKAQAIISTISND